MAATTAVSCMAAESVTSPDGKISLKFDISDTGTPCYEVSYRGQSLIGRSELGFDVKGSTGFKSGMSLVSAATSSSDSYWTPVWGENDSIRDNYNQLYVKLENKKAKTKMDIVFRVFDDGVGFRYVFPRQSRKSLTVTDELTQFAMPGDITAWWIPGDYDTQEYEYTRSHLSEIRGINEKNGHTGNVSQTSFSPTGVQTSLMLKANDSTYLNLHEAALIDFPAMHLNLDDKTMVFTSWLTPNRDGDKISFFAYAPYESNGQSGTKTGITISAATEAGIPYINFSLKKENELTKMVDLVVADALDQQYTQANGGKVSFNFKHTLSRISFKAKLGSGDFTGMDGNNLSLIHI